MTDKAKHQWAAGGLSSYPLSHPVIGQGGFFDAFQHFIQLTDNEAEKFAHVFPIIGQWGVGKSRLGYELIAQVNDTSRGWWVRDADGELEERRLFHTDADRDQYLALYIRYSQIANEYNNADNWFAFGLIKALMPLTRTDFDGSIQGEVAREAADRLFVAGFDPNQLASALEVSAKHSDETLYEDPELATRLCQAAYQVLNTLGIKYILVVLDELETAAEAATYGIEETGLKHLDGRAITLMGKALKEEDPRRKLPWLRYAALCSPAIGDELRQTHSNARRFEFAVLEANAFADVSDFVRILADEGRLVEAYPPGLIEAAYTMSAGNFGWFNVIMAGIDERLHQKRMRGEGDPSTLGALFEDLVKVSNRVQTYVLDHHAIEGVRIQDRALLTTVRDLLYGQLPVAVDTFAEATRTALLDARNEYDEAIATLFRRVKWDAFDAGEALRQAKFERRQRFWTLNGVDQPLDLRQLLSNLSTYAVHETQGRRRDDGVYHLIVPLQQAGFIELVAMLYPHPAAEDAARALWSHFQNGEDMAPEAATHIGPSIAMIARLDVRHQKQSRSALIFRDPDQNAAHKTVLDAQGTQDESMRARQVLVGAMRLIDSHWDYDAVPVAPAQSSLTLIATKPASRGAHPGGLVAFDGLKLHPKGRVLFAWVKNVDGLERLCHLASAQFGEEGRTPVVAFTASRALVDLMENPPNGTLVDAKNYLMLYQLSTTEVHILHQIGPAHALCRGFKLDNKGFSTAFSDRLQSLVRPFNRAVVDFRERLNRLGRIAWPLRCSGSLTENERALLVRAWRVLAIETPAGASLAHLDEKSGVDVEQLKALFTKLGLPPKARAADYTDAEQAGLFSCFDDHAEPCFPPFLVVLIQRLLKGSFDLKLATREWFWGYTWVSAKPKDIFYDWMTLVGELGFGKPEPKTKHGYIAVSRTELRSAYQEADNWLRRDVPDCVAEMAVLFGEGRVNELFGAEDLAKPGVKILAARRKLEECHVDLDQLDATEGRSADADAFRAAALRRRRIIEKIAWVYQPERYRDLDQDTNVHTLDFESDATPLWERIRRATLFVDQVRRVEGRLAKRTESLAEEMRLAVGHLSDFPIALFTLTLEKINHILDGALQPEPSMIETGKKQQREPGTLCQSLRDLKVAEVMTHLESLAAEVGLDLSTWNEASLDDCHGNIVPAFRELKKEYERIHAELLDGSRRLTEIVTVLHDAPAAFRYPSSVKTPTEMINRLGHIEGNLATVKADEVARLRKTHNQEAQLGKFQPLMAGARRLLGETRTAWVRLLGDIQTVENCVGAYREDLTREPRLAACQRGLAALARVGATAQPTALGLKEIEAAGALADAQRLVDRRRQQAESAGAQAMQGLGVSFERWCAIVESLEEDGEPMLEPQEADALVERGFLRRTYRLGGAS